jgi:hypothetical protein
MSKKEEMMEVVDVTALAAPSGYEVLDLCDSAVPGPNSIPYLIAPRGQVNAGKGFRTKDTVLLPSGSKHSIKAIPVVLLWEGFSKYNAIRDPQTKGYVTLKYRTQQEALEQAPAEMAKYGCTDPVTFADMVGNWPVDANGNRVSPTFVPRFEFLFLVESESGYAKVENTYYEPCIITCMKQELAIATTLKQKLMVARSRGPATLAQLECALSIFIKNDNEWLRLEVTATHTYDSDWVQEIQKLGLA